MLRVEVYSRPDCPLCDEAKEVLRGVQQELPFELVDVDVMKDPATASRYAEQVPVVFVEGSRAFRHRVDAAAARDRISRALV
jgi:glutaredoxin